MKFSNTILINALMAAAGIATYVLDHNLIVNNPDLVALIGVGISAVNIGLRYLTKTPMKGLFQKH